MAIRELDRLTSEQIAAGEVIENPASVVKELVENSLDAGATRIEIGVVEGGKKFIRVTDNGAGIDPVELLLAFKRFATSKLASLEDFATLASLGFRGEALPSIAAVARVTLTTRPRGALSGARIRLAGGAVLAQEETGAPEGTAVEVEELFYNTPGRQKFLRSAAVEMGRITALISNLALARPEVSFVLNSGVKEVLRTAGDGVLLHAIGALYGPETARAMLPLRYEAVHPGALVDGHISVPHLHRASRRWITVVINGRVVRNALVSSTLERAYGTLLPRQRYPVAVFRLQLPPAEIDVNVHPAKTEIRFHRPEQIKDLVFRAVRAALRGPLPLPVSPLAPHPAAPPPPQQYLSFKPASGAVENGGEAYRSATAGISIPPSPCEGEPVPEPGPADASLRLIGQFLHSYLVVQRGEELLLIDQHAAHERILYHALASPAPERRAVQLTLPQTVEVPAAWREPLEKALPYLEETGFKMESFGDNSYIIRQVPFVTREYPAGNDIYAMLEEICSEEAESGEARRALVRKTVACHRAIKAHQPLTRPEMEQLLSTWEKTPDCHYCPHGRPAVIAFHRAELEKGFRRRRG